MLNPVSFHAAAALLCVLDEPIRQLTDMLGMNLD